MKVIDVFVKNIGRTIINMHKRVKRTDFKLSVLFYAVYLKTECPPAGVNLGVFYLVE